MSIEQTEVLRESIHHSPLSNTELNFDRLPNAKALENMELRYRGAPVASRLVEEHLAASFILLTCFGSLYTAALGALPVISEWLLKKAQAIEGMTVVGGMAGVLVLILGLLCTFLLPASLRIALVAVTAPPAAAISLRRIGFGAEGLISVGIAMFICVFVWKNSLSGFHRSWVSSDPKMTTQQTKAWMASSRSGWSLPAPLRACEILWRYLSHEASYSVAPGVWIPPSSRSKRIWIASLLAGCVFSLATGWHAVLQPFAAWLGLAAVTSLMLLYAATVWVTGEACWMNQECEGQLGGDGRTVFERSSDRLRNSEQEAKDPITGARIREAEHLFLGEEPWQRFPIFLHNLLLGEHVYVAGRTGSGKTSMALMSLLIQLLRGNREPGGWSKPKPMVVIDLKGDPALFQTAKLEAEARGQKFRFFTLEPGKATYYFNPFVCFKSQSMTTAQLVQMVLDALALFHGFEYGRGYFSQCSRLMLSEALRNPAGVNNFRDLHVRLQALSSQRPQEFQEARELRSVVESLTHYEQLITTDLEEQGNNTIRFDRLLEDRDVVYFWLPTTKESITSAHIGRLVLLCLRVAAHDRQVACEPKRDVVLMIDEFQKLASEHFEKVLQQARSSGIGAILANQSIADLTTVDRDLIQTVRTNTRVKMFFSVTEPDEIEAFRELSGEEVQTFGVSDVEEIRVRLSTKDLAALSDHPKRLLLQVTSGSGYTQFAGLPIPVETDWPISKELSEERSALPWPRQPQIRKPPSPPTARTPNPNPPAPVPAPQAVPLQHGPAPGGAPAKPKAKKVGKKPTPSGALSTPPSATQKAAIANTIKNLMNP